jgi:capsule polysaccharide export protein KpsC/LpsZ
MSFDPEDDAIEQEQQSAKVERESLFAVQQAEWHRNAVTQFFYDELEAAAIKLNEQAKNLAMHGADDKTSAQIRALLIESKTIQKVLDYGQRNSIDTKYT